jgi:hypothetical protein
MVVRTRFLMKVISFIRVMLTYALRAQVKEFEKEIKNKFYIESITFAIFKILNAHAQVPKKNFLRLHS